MPPGSAALNRLAALIESDARATVSTTTITAAFPDRLSASTSNDPLAASQMRTGTTATPRRLLPYDHGEDEGEENAATIELDSGCCGEETRLQQT